MATEQHDTVRAVAWQEGRLRLLDQRRLPDEETVLELDNVTAVAHAIAAMAVRGAPAIGIAAAYGTVLAARRRLDDDGPHWRERLDGDLERLAGARPTAVNLRWAIERMRRVLDAGPADPHAALLAEAEAIHAEDIAANRAMGALGAALLDGPARAVLTHCNTGSLATGGFGTALGVIRRAYADGRIERVYADETRPWLQGSRLTAWELVRDGIPATLLCEGAAASLLAGGEVGWVIVGADRVTANGDVANKIGTYGLAIAARHHGVRFMVVAPTATVDRAIADGRDIPIEQRPAEEVLDCRGQRIAAAGVDAWNPAFDVTPVGLVDALVTERGVASPPSPAAIAALFAA